MPTTTRWAAHLFACEVRSLDVLPDHRPAIASARQAAIGHVRSRGLEGLKRGCGPARLGLAGRRRAILVLTIAILSFLPAASALAGCGGATPPPANTGIEGTVSIGPISPVSRPGEPDSRPFVATLVIKRLPGGTVAATVTSAPKGAFRVLLAPGRYVIEPQQGSPLPTARSQEVTVAAGSFTHVDIAYDSGIR